MPPRGKGLNRMSLGGWDGNISSLRMFSGEETLMWVSFQGFCPTLLCSLVQESKKDSLNNILGKHVDIDD